VLVAATLLWLLFRRTDWSELVGALRGVDLRWLAAAQLLICAAFLARVQRWSYVVRAVHPASYRSLFSATQIGMLVNFAIPARLGEVVRAYVLSRLLGLPMARSLAMVAFDRVNDLIGLLAVLLVAALALARDVDATFPAGALGNAEPFTIPSALLRPVAWSLAIGVLAASLGLVLLYAQRDRAPRLVGRLSAPLSEVLAQRLAALLESFAEGLHVFRSAGDLGRAVLWSLASWGADVAAAAAVLVAFDVVFPWYTPFVILSFVGVAIVVPVTPGTIGQFHLAAAAGLLLAAPEVAPARAKAVAIVDHLSILAPITALGLYCLFRERIGLVDAVRRSAPTTSPGLVLLLASLALAAPAAALDWAIVGDSGNAPDDEVACRPGSQTLFCRTNIGAVAYSFAIAKHEITNEEYVELLNATAASDPQFLFNEFMQNPPPDVGLPGEIVREGGSGAYTYSVVSGFERRPIRFVNFAQAVRFVNWQHNGKPAGPQDATTTEDGAYTLVGSGLVDVQRNAGALFWLPSEDEWYKAAYYEPGVPAGQWPYWDYATRADAPPRGEPPPGGTNSGNLCPPDPVPPTPTCDPLISMGPGEPTDVGAYLGSPGPWGSFDQTGNVWELLEDRVDTGSSVQGLVRGGVYSRGPGDAGAFSRTAAPLLAQGNSGIGFRIAAVEAVPEPAQGVLQLVAGTWLLCCARRARKSARAKRHACAHPVPRAPGDDRP
jgi:uncharacterized membrane protein YbhN (UPF0104 family)/formylglycine-generating enzyme required for sulfatase activity